MKKILKFLTVYILLNFLLNICIFSDEFALNVKKDTLKNSNTILAQRYIQKAKIHEEEGDIDLAIADLKKAITIDPKIETNINELRGKKDVEFWIKKAHHSFFLAEKILCYNKALKISPNEKEVLKKLGKVYYKDKKYNKSKETFEKLLELSPENKFAKKYLKKLKKHDSR